MLRRGQSYEDSLPVAQDGIESGYQELIVKEEEQQQRKEHARWEKSGQDMEDYYATWVHQNQGTDCCG